MNVRGRYHGFPEGNGVAQGAAGRLLEIWIRGEIDIAGFKLIEQLIRVQKAVLPFDGMSYPKFFCKIDQAFSIAFTFACYEVGMRCSDDPVADVRVHPENGRKGLDNGFKALSGAEQAEGREHRSIAKPARCLELLFPAKWPIRGTVFDDLRNFMGRMVLGDQAFPRERAHDHDPRASLDEVIDDTSLVIGRMLEDSVECDDERGSDPIDQVQDHLAIGATKNSELVLQPDCISRGSVDCTGSFQVAGMIIGQNLTNTIAAVFVSVRHCPDVELDVAVVSADVLDNI